MVQVGVRRDGTRLRSGLALVQGEDGVQRWAETFVVDHAMLAQTLADIAARITRALAPALPIATVEQRAALSALKVSADDLAMRATALWYRGFTEANIAESLRLLERAMALDADGSRSTRAADSQPARVGHALSRLVAPACGASRCACLIRRPGGRPHARPGHGGRNLQPGLA